MPKLFTTLLAHHVLEIIKILLYLIFGINIYNRLISGMEESMKSYRKELWFNAPERMHFTNITPDVREVPSESGIKRDLSLINAMHITASVFINDDESGLHHDYKKWLEQPCSA
jgi:hypothetical protein